ncbi:hypothetical protein C8R44DRAFT_781308 [Mycena epipterygia]|nr:hypothetical protein C8R44DRAFT_781308 [Mycena epipterygia]
MQSSNSGFKKISTAMKIPLPFGSVSSVQLQTQQHETCANPFLTLPPEIVAEIFVKFIPSYPDRPPLFGVLSPLLLCEISRQWRQIALSTPTLWRSIRIDINEPGGQGKVERKLDVLATWLSRSGRCPLSICLRYYPEHECAPPSLSKLVEAIMIHCERWEHIELDIPFRDLHLLQGNMPLLRDLTFGPTELQKEDEDVLTLFDRAPKLASVILTENFETSFIRLPWAQLTRLDGRTLFDYECTEILSHAVQLVHCTLTIYSFATSPNPMVPTNQHMRSLTLFLQDEGSATFLDGLTLPGLRTLQTSEHCGLNALKAFIERSQCALEELRIINSPHSEGTYRDMLPSVKIITVIHE